MINVTIDGYRLSYPGTGLGLVSAELLRAFQELGYAKSIAVFVEKSFAPQMFELDDLEVKWIKVDYQLYSTDYLSRLSWAKAVVKEMKKFDTNSQHFIPYFYNYGNLRRNVVLIPDLIYKSVIPDSTKFPNQPWWNWRGRLPIRPMFAKWEESLVMNSEKLVVYSEFVKNNVHEELGITHDKISLIPLATPSWVVNQYDKNNNEKVRGTFKLPPRFALYVGGFALRKNIPMLLQACGQVYEQEPSFRCVFVGLTDNIIENDYGIKTALNNNSVKAAIIPLPNLSYPDLASIYRLAEFSVYPSMSEGFGLPILEAAAAKRLCLCGDNTSMQEIQIYPEYRIDSNNSQAWVKGILDFWRNPDATKNGGNKSQNLCNQYSWKKSAEQLWHLFQNEFLG